MNERIQTFEEFFPYYLGQHSLPATRALHYIGTTLFLASLVAFAVTLQWPYILLAVFVGYLFAWIGHFFIEHNRPATFTYPGWSFISDLKMYFLFVTGQIGKHLEAAGVGVVAEPVAEHEPTITAEPDPEPEPTIAVKPEPNPEPEPTITPEPEPTVAVEPQADPDPEPRQE